MSSISARFLRQFRDPRLISGALAAGAAHASRGHQPWQLALGGLALVIRKKAK